MNEVNNMATSSGTYDSIPTSLTSNTSVVNLVDGLTLTMDADKKTWVSGYLTYTITLDNTTGKAYLKPIIKDEIDTSKIEFVTGSVKINGVEATEGQHSYDDSTHTLTVNLDDVAQSSTTIVTFSVKKKI